MVKQVVLDPDLSDLPPLEPGDRIEFRDLRRLLPAGTPIDNQGIGSDGCWGTLPYRLIDGTCGRLLAVNYIKRDTTVFNGDGMPPELEIRLPDTGRYAIWLGVPLLGQYPRLAGPGAAGGMDIAVEGDPFINVAPEFGIRYGRDLEEQNREIFVFFRTVEACGQKLRLRVPFGTFASLPLGLVRASLSCLRLVCLTAEEPAVWTGCPEEAAANHEEAKPLILVCDGFSHYFSFANIGECLDLRIAEYCRDSDFKICMLQIHGSALWDSQLTSSFGTDLTEADFVGKRAGDRRVCEYVRWSIKHGQEGLRRQTEACHQLGLEMHFSIRANLFMKDDSQSFMTGIEKYMNGRWWLENPDLRQKDNKKLDYGQPRVRAYIRAYFLEVMERFDIDGINLDFTRWPPVFDPQRNPPELLLTIAQELRSLLDEINQRTGRHMRLSMSFVDGYNAGMTLEQQNIDFTALMAARLLDFVCVEAWNGAEYCRIAHQYNTPIFLTQDGESVHWPGGFREDPLWVLPDGSQQDDPKAGEEHMAQPYIRNYPTPQEFNLAFNRFYEAGADGINIVNFFLGTLSLRDSGHPKHVRQRAETGDVYGQVKGQYLFIQPPHSNGGEKI